MGFAKQIFGALVFTGLIGFPAASGAEIVDRIIAVVNDDIILLSDLNAQVEKVTPNIGNLDYPLEKQRTILYQLREKTLQELIDKKLAEQEIKRLEMRVSEGDIDEALARFKANNRLSDEQFLQVIEQQNMTLEAYREELREQLLRNRLMSSEVRSKIVITPAEIEAYYKANRADYAAEVSYRLKNILSPISVSETEARQRMEAVRERIEAGMDFEAAARQFSQAPNAERGGELGKFTAGSLSAPIAAAITSLEAGELSPIVATDQGLQLFLLEEIDRREATPLEEVTPQIEETLYNQVIDEKFQKWITSLRENAFIKIIQ